LCTNIKTSGRLLVYLARLQSPAQTNYNELLLRKFSLADQTVNARQVRQRLVYVLVVRPFQQKRL
jgi:hypothetical protein